MSISSDGAVNVRIMQGDLLKSHCQTIVNTVNTVGVMGKGIALAFKKRYPEMYLDYVKRCDRGEVSLGRPYAYQERDHLIVNFPTKGHWRAVSRLDDIVEGLEYLMAHATEWGIESIAVPPLGCGNGQLDWDVVKPTLVRHLSTLNIPVHLYAPHEASAGQMALPMGNELDAPRKRFVATPALAWVKILALVQAEPYHWPIGRVYAQKIAYFASAAGLPLSLDWQAGSYGPFANDLKSMVANLQNNGLVREESRGRMIELVVGGTAQDAFSEQAGELDRWDDVIARTADLVCRFDTNRAEVAATVHYAAVREAQRLERIAFASEVIDVVERWKLRRKPPLKRSDIVEAIVNLAMQNWIDIQYDDSLAEYLESAA